MWSVIVALPAVQAEFGVARSAASLPYTMTMICFGVGGILMGRLSDRFGIMLPVAGRAPSRSALGYAVASQATSLWQFALAQGLLVGVASSATFGPLDRRHLALVHAPPRHGGGDHRERQLSGGHGLAAGRAALHPERGLAPDVPRHRRVLRRDHGAAGAGCSGGGRR